MPGPLLCLSPLPARQAPILLLVDRSDMCGFLVDRGSQPAGAVFCGCQASCAIAPRLCIIRPGRVGDQIATLNPIHVVMFARNEIRFIDHSIHMNEARAKMEHERGLQLTRMAHSAARRAAVLFKRFAADRAGGMQPCCGGESSRELLTGKFHNVYQERMIAPVPVKQVETVGAAHKEIDDDRQQEILVEPASKVERAGKGIPVGADPIGECWQRRGRSRQSFANTAGNRLDDDAVGIQGQVMPVLLGVPGRDEHHMLWIKRCNRFRRALRLPGQAQDSGKIEDEPFRMDQGQIIKAIEPKNGEEVGQNLLEERRGNRERAARPAIGERR